MRLRPRYRARPSVPRSSTETATSEPSRPHPFWNRCAALARAEVIRLPQEFDVVCLGGGVAGEAIAGGLQGSGLTLAVVERELVGGECPYWGCIPSKTLLRSGETLEEAGRARNLAASRVEWDLDFPKVSKRVYWMARDLDDSRPAKALEATGAKLVRGEGKLIDLRTVKVGVILTLKSGTTVHADRLLVATGRRPNFEAWQASGLQQTERGWLKVDPATLEAHANVYGAGDVTGIGGFTHLAFYHAQIIARRLRGEDARADHTAVPRVTFTDPEVASVGLSEAAAREGGISVITASADPAEAARGYIHDFHGGTLKLIGDRDRGVLIGATLVTPRAGEILGELVLALQAGTPLKMLADVIHPFPAINPVLGAVLQDLAAKAA